MSSDLVNAALWIQLHPTRKLVLVALCERADLATGLCWPGRDELACRASITPRNVSPHLKALLDAGYVRRERRGNVRLGQTTRRWLDVGLILREGEAAREEFRRRQAELYAATLDEPDPFQAVLPLGDESSCDEIDQGTLDAGLGDVATLETVIEPSDVDEEDARAIATRLDRLAARFAVWGKVTVGTARAIEEAAEDFGLDWLERAERACRAGGYDDRPPWNYVEATLRRWQKQGGPDEPDEKPARPTRNGARGRTVGGPDPGGWDAYKRAYDAGEPWPERR